jgi:hypothetical protein
METLMQPDQLRVRILLWAEEEIRLNKLPPKSGAILDALLYRGELPRGDAVAIVGTGERQARRVVSALIDQAVLTSEHARPCALPSWLSSPRVGCRPCFLKKKIAANAIYLSFSDENWLAVQQHQRAAVESEIAGSFAQHQCGGPRNYIVDKYQLDVPVLDEANMTVDQQEEHGD